MELIGIPGPQIDEARPFIEEHLERCAEAGMFTADDLVAAIKDRSRQCWVVVAGGGVEAMLLTQIGEDRLKTCRITHLSGQRPWEWAHLIAALEAWAVSVGCKRMEAHAHPNWERMGKEAGFRKTHIIIEKELPDGQQPDDDQQG